MVGQRRAFKSVLLSREELRQLRFVCWALLIEEFCPFQLASRVASEMQCSVGDRVGYVLRFAEVMSEQTKIKVSGGFKSHHRVHF